MGDVPCWYQMSEQVLKPGSIVRAKKSIYCTAGYDDLDSQRKRYPRKTRFAKDDEIFTVIKNVRTKRLTLHYSRLTDCVYALDTTGKLCTLPVHSIIKLA